MNRPGRPRSEVTRLSAKDEPRFQAWAQRNQITDVDHSDSHYDYRGYWKATGGASHAPGDHFPDTFKQHGHPTFSVESQYSHGPNDGGRWQGETFIPPASKNPTHERIRALIEQQNREAAHEENLSHLSPATRALGFALGLGRQFNVLGEGNFLKPEPTLSGPPTLHDYANAATGAVDAATRFAHGVAQRDPEALGSLAGIAAPLAPAAISRLSKVVAGLGERGAVSIPGTEGRGFAVKGKRATPAVPTNRAAAVGDMQDLSGRLGYARSQLGATAPVLPSQELPPAGSEPGLRPLTGTARGFEVTGDRATPLPPSEGGNMSLEEMHALTRRLNAARSPMPVSLPERYAILTAENPGGAAASPEANARAMDQLNIRLQIMGKHGVPTKGAYVDAGNLLHENGVLVPGMSAADAKKIAQSFGQNSVITHEGFHDLTTGKTTPISKVEHDVAPEAPYTELPGGRRFRMSFDRPATPLSDVVSSYRQQAGIASEPLPKVRTADAEAGSRMAKTYEGLKNDPQNPEVRAAYKAFTTETASQAQALRDAGYSWDYVDKDPYKNSAEMLKDLRDNRHINVLKTDPASGHPLMTPDENNLFRAVHDIMGHGVEGHSFGAAGEENAFRGHASMYSPLAQRAMATETRGQNSWFNYGPHRDLPVSQRPFATQKAALWPEEQLGEYPAKAAAPARSMLAPPVPQLSLADWHDIFRYGGFNPAEGAPGIAALSKGLPPIEPGSILSKAQAGSVLTGIPQEAPIFAPEPQRIGRFAEIKDQISRALEHPLVQEDIERGIGMGFHDWYNSDAIARSAIEHLGPEKGRAAFKQLMDYMGPTSISSSPEPNLRLAGYQYWRGLNPGAPQWAPGFRPLYPGLVNSKLAELEQMGALNPVQAPKIARFPEALAGNWAGGVFDRHFWRALKDYGFEGRERGGGVNYGPTESAFADKMQQLADEGALPVPDNRSPTSAGQAAIWGGAGERTGVRNIAEAPSTFSDIFEQAVHRTAHYTGMPHGDVLRSFWTGGMPLF